MTQKKSSEAADLMHALIYGGTVAPIKKQLLTSEEARIRRLRKSLLRTIKSRAPKKNGK